MSHEQQDVSSPRQLIIPIVSGASTAQPATSGSMFISGSKLYFFASGVAKLVTSA